jgi:hypothetical protein
LPDASEVAKHDDGREQGDEGGVQQKHFCDFSLACMGGLCPSVCFSRWELRLVCGDLPCVARKRLAWDDCKVKTRNRTVHWIDWERKKNFSHKNTKRLRRSYMPWLESGSLGMTAKSRPGIGRCIK